MQTPTLPAVILNTDETFGLSMNLLQHTDPLTPIATQWPGVSQASSHEGAQAQLVLILDNTVDPSELKHELSRSLQGQFKDIGRIDLHFPKFTDGRAFSQAVMLRRRCGFAGDIRATGEVLIDQIVQMKRTGFTSAVLRADQNAEHAQKLMAQFSDFYQGDAINAQPLFARPPR